jgi:DnaJ-class molecular chaperone
MNTEPVFPPATVPCQDCLGFGRYWDRIGLTLHVCPTCNGTGTDEDEGAGVSDEQ